MGIWRHGFGVLDKAVPILHSHGLTADGKTVAHHFEKGECPGSSGPKLLNRRLDLYTGRTFKLSSEPPRAAGVSFQRSEF